jgi:hypothetical protein
MQTSIDERGKAWKNKAWRSIRRSNQSAHMLSGHIASFLSLIGAQLEETSRGVNQLASLTQCAMWN